MPILPGSVYAGYGQCEISPSDLASAVDNLWNQVIALKQEVELLKSSNTIVGAIDEISQDLGTMTNATLINAARGWITEGTFSGVAISTLGWTLPGCDGNPVPFPVVSVREDGSLNFGFDENGNVCGAQADTWNAAAAEAIPMDYASVANVAGGSTQSISRGITITTNSNVAGFVTVEFTVANTGTYWFGGHYTTSHTAGGGIGDVRVALAITVNGVNKFGDNQSSPYNGTTEATGAFVSAAVSGLLSLTAGDVVGMTGSETDSFGSDAMQNYDLSLLRVSS